MHLHWWASTITHHLILSWHFCHQWMSTWDWTSDPHTHQTHENVVIGEEPKNLVILPLPLYHTNGGLLYPLLLPGLFIADLVAWEDPQLHPINIVNSFEIVATITSLIYLLGIEFIWFFLAWGWQQLHEHRSLFLCCCFYCFFIFNFVTHCFYSLS